MPHVYPYTDAVAIGAPDAIDIVRRRFLDPDVMGLMLIVATDGSGPALAKAAATVCGGADGTRRVVWVHRPSDIQPFLDDLGILSVGGIKAIALDCAARAVARILKEVPNGLEAVKMEAAFLAANA